MKKILLLFVILMLVACSNDENTLKKITYADAKELISTNEVTIIDVRSVEEYQNSHIENAINIPLDTISIDVLNDVIFAYESNIIVYCASGFRSNKAQQLLIDLGYINVYDLGSIDNWGDSNE